VAAGLVVGLLGIAGATAVFGLNQSGEAPVVVAQADDESTRTTPAEGTARPERGDRLRDAIAPLVEDGTITQAQADAVVEQLLSKLPERGDGPRGGRFSGHGPRGGHERGERLAAVAEVLGLTADELRDALRDGSTLAELADEAGVNLDALVDAMLAPLRERLDAAVADGRITQERADAKLEWATERITAMIEGARPGRGALGD
jgi:hypothetical protein